MSSPTKRAYLKWDSSNAADDFLQLTKQDGSVPGWIDSSGSLQGTLFNGIVSVANLPAICTPGLSQPVNLTTAPYGIYSCTSTNVWTQGGSIGGPQQTAVRLSTQCLSTDTNCFQVFQDGQVSVGATWSANTSNGTAATSLTTNANDLGAQYLQINTPQTNIGGMFTSTNGGSASILAAFKVVGTLGVPASGVGTNEQASSSTTITVGPFTPTTSGPGSVLIVFAACFQPDQASITFSDNNGNTWVNVLPKPTINTGLASVQMAYVQNNNSGSTTITATFSSSATFRSIFVCNFSGLASASVFDSAVGGVGGTTVFAGTLTTTGNDLLFQAARSNGASTYTVGTLGIAGNTITTNSFDPPYTSLAIGQKVVLTSACDVANGYVGRCTSALTNPSATIVSVNGPHSITVNSLLSISNTAPVGGFTGWMISAHDDGAQYAAAFNKALTIPGATLFLPCGLTILGQQPFNEGTTFPTWNPNISGCAGETGTVLVPSLDFNYASAVGAIIANIPNNNGILAGSVQSPAIYGRLEKFSIWGGGTGGSSLGSLPVISANNIEIDSVDCTGFGVSANTFISGHSLRVNNAHGWICGGVGLAYLGDAGGSTEWGYVRGSYFQSGTGANVSSITVSAGHLESSSNSIYGNGSSCVAYSVGVTGGEFTSHHDKHAGISVSAGAVNIEDDGYAGVGVCGAALNISGTGNVAAEKSLIDTFTMSAGSFNDLGGNYHTAVGTPWTNGTLSVTGGTLVGTGSITGVVVAANKLVLSAGWGTTASWTTGPTGFTKRVQGTLTASGTGQAANPTITYTFPTPFGQATNIICKATQIGGTQAAVANPFTVGAPSATSVVFTYTGTPGAGNTLQIVFECDAA
jgi:hypothetical protein